MAGRRGGFREAVRGVVLAPDGCILLLEYAYQRRGKKALWLTPGGGIEDGESPQAGLRREIEEETGLARFEVGPLLWRREWRSPHFNQRERFYLVEVPRFEANARRMGKQERRAFRGFRWWRGPEIATASARFAPRDLDQHLDALLTRGPPQRPIDVT